MNLKGSPKTGASEWLKIKDWRLKKVGFWRLTGMGSLHLPTPFPSRNGISGAGWEVGNPAPGTSCFVFINPNSISPPVEMRNLWGPFSLFCLSVTPCPIHPWSRWFSLQNRYRVCLFPPPPQHRSQGPTWYGPHHRLTALHLSPLPSGWPPPLGSTAPCWSSNTPSTLLPGSLARVLLSTWNTLLHIPARPGPGPPLSLCSNLTFSFSFSILLPPEACPSLISPLLHRALLFLFYIAFTSFWLTLLIMLIIYWPSSPAKNES